MSSSFQILSHAGLLVKSANSSIVVDPWLLGSCYWRSWWNFPQAVFDQSDLDAVDAVVISHIHWDHWHGLTLKKLLHGKPIIVGDDPNIRSINDLKNIGFADIQVAKHGQQINIGDISITFFNFGLFLNDAAIVIETPEFRLLNANDAKLTGLSLSALVKRFKHFDFALRSHSSANSRVCFEVTSELHEELDEREHYFRSFELFMNAVRPKYAVPFASNHCHLHSETFKFNDYISNPRSLQKYLDQRTSSERGWELAMMLPGSNWRSDLGFQFSNQRVFDDLGANLSEALAAAQPTLEKYENREERVSVTDGLLSRFQGMARKCGKLRCNTKIVVTLTRPSGPYISLCWDGRNIRTLPEVQMSPVKNQPLIIIPAAIFRDSIIKNMFHHAGISKRVRYMAVDASDLKTLQKFIGGLEFQELRGDDSAYWPRLILRQLRRWRDFHAYGLAFYYLFFRRTPLYLAEEKILRKHSGAVGGGE